MTQPPRPKLIILTCMRSYSSLVSGMLGQHSGLYTLPEINPFAGDSIDEIVSVFKLVRPRSLDGLYRMVAELEFGRQNFDTVNQAKEWLTAHHDWTPAQLMDWVSEKVAPRIPVEKSPATTVMARGIPTALKYCPEAHFLHLCRHPIATTTSIARITNFGKSHGLRKSMVKDPELSWYSANQTILDAARGMRADRFISIRGEDILSDPDRWLRQIGDWLGIATTARDLDDMRHPERSPFARYGPVNAPYGADPNYLEHPAYKQRPITMAPLNTPLYWDMPRRRLAPESMLLAQQMGYGGAARTTTTEEPVT